MKNIWPALAKINPLSLIAFVLMSWALINWLSTTQINWQTASGYPFLMAPFVYLDGLTPNPDNDPDGPFVFGLLFLPLFALALALLGLIVDKLLRRRDQSSRRVMEFSLIVMGLIILFGAMMSVPF